MVRNRKTINRWTRWLVGAAMLVHLSVPFGHGMSFAALADGADNKILTLVICSAMGGTVQISEDGNSKAPSGQSAPCSCEFCLTCHSLCNEVMSSPSVALPRAVAMVYPPGVYDSTIYGRPQTHHRQRAPPSFA